MLNVGKIDIEIGSSQTNKNILQAGRPLTECNIRECLDLLNFSQIMFFEQAH